MSDPTMQFNTHTQVQRKVMSAWAAGVAVHISVLCGLVSALPLRAAQATDPGNPAVRSIIRLPSTVLDGDRVSELSGLAWGADEQVLYGISDRGYLYRFRLKLENRHLRAVEPMDAVRLRWPAHMQDKTAGIDAEGLAILRGDNGVMGDTELLLSTEGQPQVLRVSTGGKVLGLLTLPEPLSDARL